MVVYVRIFFSPRQPTIYNITVFILGNRATSLLVLKINIETLALPHLLRS